MKAIKRLSQLALGASVLAMSSGGPAHAIPPVCPPDDFSSNPGSPTALPSGTSTVNGMLGCEIDEDYFLFSGLTEGDSFWLTFVDEDNSTKQVTDISNLVFSIDGAPLTMQPGLGFARRRRS